MRRAALFRLSSVILLAVVLVLALAGAVFAWNGYSAKYDWTGSGTASDPWVITTPEQLKGFANRVNTGTTYSGSFFKLGADIDLGSHAWVPIGGACTFGLDSSGDHDVPTGAHFDGVFDGGDHTISGLNVSNPGTGTGGYGLFGYVNGGAIANLTVAGSLNMGTKCINAIGSVVGYCRASLFNVHSSVTVYMNDSTYLAESCGGIAGVVENLTGGTSLWVRYCSNTGSVTGRGRMGGVVGSVYCASDSGAVVDQCFNTGGITATTSSSKVFTGGIVGYCRGFISSCYNQGDLTTSGGHYLAGIAGILTGRPTAPTASISKCYSTAVFHDYNPSYDRWLWASADFNPAVHVTDCFWLPDASNSDITQPDTDDSWGMQTFVSSVTSPELQGTAQMTESNRSGIFSGHVLDYLDGLDLTNSNGSYGFGYASPGTYPILGWQLISNFYVDLSNGMPAPSVSYSVAADVTKGAGSVSENPIMVTGGGSSTVTLSPAAGYYLGTITDNGADVSALVSGGTYTITNITDNHTVLVTYTNGGHALTYGAGAHGTISGAASQSVVTGDDGTPVTAVADAGYRFVDWTDGSTENPRTDTDVTADISVKAIFLLDDFGTTRPWDHFTIAVLPDTQYYTESNPAILDEQAQWIADNAKSENIVFVSQLGDLVDAYNSDSQWQNAHDSMAIIRATGIPYSVVPGNHDLLSVTSDLNNYDTYFPYTGFTGYTWYGGHYPDTSNASNFELFSAMGQNFIVLNLVADPTLQAGATGWANSILSEYGDRKAIVVTHGYVDTSGAYLNDNSVAGLAAWNNVVSLHSNVIAVLCGHYSGEYHGTATGQSGNTVYNLLTDYQSEPNGGNGWLRLYEFYPVENKISAVTYSPHLGQYQTDSDGQFDLALPQNSCAVASGWNLVAGAPGTAFPDALFGWDGGSYMSTTTCAAWQGYWCKVGTAQIVAMSIASGPHTTTLTDGWNLIGNPMGGVATLTLPSGRSAFYYYPPSGVYVSSTTLAPGQGAWVKGTAGETVGFDLQQ